MASRQIHPAKESNEQVDRKMCSIVEAVAITWAFSSNQHIAALYEIEQ